jgi:hypothetical protein
LLWCHDTSIINQQIELLVAAQKLVGTSFDEVEIAKVDADNFNSSIMNFGFDEASGFVPRLFWI